MRARARRCAAAMDVYARGAHFGSLRGAVRASTTYVVDLTSDSDDTPATPRMGKKRRRVASACSRFWSRLGSPDRSRTRIRVLERREPGSRGREHDVPRPDGLAQARKKEEKRKSFRLGSVGKKWR